MTATTVHDIDIVEIRAGRWQAVCSCGQYTSSGHAIPSNAEQSGAAHVRGKGGIPSCPSR